jgi:acyl-CoA hydrolase
VGHNPERTLPTLRNLKSDGVPLSFEQRLVSPETVLSHIEPGMTIFLGTGVAEPRTLVKELISSRMSNLNDLELIQLISLGDAVLGHVGARPGKFRLKTFFSGWLASDAITSGAIDLIPSRISRIPSLIQSGVIGVDVVFVQITPFDETGFASLGIAIDAAKYAWKGPPWWWGKSTNRSPGPWGTPSCTMDEFDFFVRATEPPIYFDRWP